MVGYVRPMVFGSQSRAVEEQADSAAFTFLSGLLCSIALGQLAIAAGSPASGGPAAGGIIAFITAIAIWTKRKSAGDAIAVGVEWFYALLCLFALIPAIAAVFGSGCGSGGPNKAAVVGTMTIFALVFSFSLIYALYRGLKFADLRYVGLGWFGFIEVVLFWSEPTAWTRLGGDGGTVFIAMVAAAISGAAVAVAPKIGMAVLGTVTALGAILAASTGTALECTENDGRSAAFGLVITYLVVGGFLCLLANRRNRG